MLQVRAFAGDHDRQGFDCGRQVQNDWLRQVARQHQEKGLSKTFVVFREEAPNESVGCSVHVFRTHPRNQRCA